MTLPLEGIRLLDSAHQYPGPYCSMLLSDLGAEVIKIEQPGKGDTARRQTGFFNAINRGKKSITLDLKKEPARKILHRLVKTADVLTEGFRPGVAQRIGMDYPTLEAINPRIICCSISGFGQNGPYRDLPGHDLNYQALSGMLCAFSDNNGNPIHPKVAVGDLSSGMFAVIGILSALAAREKTGKGQHVDVSMFNGLLSWMSTAMGIHQDTGKPFRVYDPGYGIYRGSDGTPFTLGIAHEDWFWERLCTALGLDELKGMANPQRTAKKEALAQKLQDIFSTKPAEEWIELLIRADVPVARIQSPEDLVNDPHVKDQNLIQEMVNPAGEKSLQVAFPVKLSKTPAVMQGPPPMLGQNNEQVLKSVGYSEREIEEFARLEVI
ncbi:MAG: CoA transferase [Proteobacteria bacterium]|nr:CoA transferase [Pseudomonadota bacterium]MBU4468864.1 CoA transferase [Pseudomonadota bacterium]MCG2750857.1 CoA transferase [Desulfobacteraceae bacterium]